MKIRGLISFMALALFAGGNSWAVEITGTAPTVTITNPNITGSVRTAVEGALNDMVGDAFDETIASTNEDLSGFSEQKELAQGMANANAYSVHSGSFTGFQNYKLFALGGGFMMGVQAPSLDLGYLSKVGDEINEKGDIYAGLGFGFTYFNLGFNAGMLVEGLYLNAKFGKMSREVSDFSLDFTQMGIGANYSVLGSKSLIGLVTWRGVSVGTGLYFQSTDLNIRIERENAVETNIPVRDNILALSDGSAGEDLAYSTAADELGFTNSAPDAIMSLSPAFDMGLDISTTTIPLDVTTGLGVLFGMLNVNVGAGFDINFGNAEIVLVGETVASTEAENPSASVEFTDADVTIDGSSDNGPSFARTRLNAGVALGLGPVKADIQTIYFLNSGFAFGVNWLIVW